MLEEKDKNIRSNKMKRTNEIARISSPMFNLIISFQSELQEKENQKNKRKPKKVTFVEASAKLSQILDTRLKTK